MEVLVLQNKRKPRRLKFWNETLEEAMRAIRKVISGELLTKQAIRKNVLRVPTKNRTYLSYFST
jgi:hypothetical protein